MPAEITAVSYSNDRVKVQITYTGVFGTVVNTEVVGPDADLPVIVRDRLAALEGAYTLFTGIKLGPITPAPAPAPPTAAMLAERALRAAMSDYEQAVRIAAADPTYDVTPAKQAVAAAQASLASAQHTVDPQAVIGKL